MKLIDRAADAAAEPLALAERQLREPVGVDLVADVEVGSCRSSTRDRTS